MQGVRRRPAAGTATHPGTPTGATRRAWYAAGVVLPERFAHFAVVLAGLRPLLEAPARATACWRLRTLVACLFGLVLMSSVWNAWLLVA